MKHGQPTSRCADRRLSEALAPHCPYRRALIVANPIAGRGKGEHAARELATGLGELGVSVELFLTGARDEGRVKVRCADPETDLIVAVGGDGTVGEVLSGMMDDEVPVAILPMGTSNVLGLDLGLPRDVDTMIEMMLRRRTQKVDLASVNGHVSFLCTGVGIDGAIVRALEARRTGPITKLSYARPIAECVLHFPPPKLTVELDGEVLEEPYELVVASNIIHYAGYLKFSRDCRLDDGELEVYLFRSTSKLAMLGVALRGLVGRLPGGVCTMRKARRMKVTSETPVPYQVDGDFRGETPVELEMTGRQIHLLVPGGSA